jgi:hypothetical protein
MGGCVRAAEALEHQRAKAFGRLRVVYMARAAGTASAQSRFRISSRSLSVDSAIGLCASFSKQLLEPRIYSLEVPIYRLDIG